jgi:hypothetical protein
MLLNLLSKRVQSLTAEPQVSFNPNRAESAWHFFFAGWVARREKTPAILLNQGRLANLTFFLA